MLPMHSLRRPLTNEMEQAWYAALQKSCSGGVCRAGSSTLIEFLALTTEKAKAMGIDSNRTGYLLGFLVPDQVWPSHQRGRHQSLHRDGIEDGGVEIGFQKQPKARPLVEKKQDWRQLIMATAGCGGGFKFSRADDPKGFDLVIKCEEAAVSGDFEGVNKRCFELSLETLAKRYAAENGIDYHAAYSAVFATPLGKSLYDGYLAAPSPQEQPVSKQDDDNPACAAIQKAAAEIRQPGESEAQAITRALTERPELYTQYLSSKG